MPVNWLFLSLLVGNLVSCGDLMWNFFHINQETDAQPHTVWSNGSWDSMTQLPARAFPTVHWKRKRQTEYDLMDMGGFVCINKCKIDERDHSLLEWTKGQEREYFHLSFFKYYEWIKITYYKMPSYCKTWWNQCAWRAQFVNYLYTGLIRLP